MRIVVLTGGIGGAKFLVGVRAHARAIGADVTAVVNVGDDVRMHGLRICPDLDSVMYTLGGAHDPERGWGRVGESWVLKEELAAYGAEPTWFGLGDKDIATHLVRTQMLTAAKSRDAHLAALRQIALTLQRQALTLTYNDVLLLMAGCFFFALPFTLLLARPSGEAKRALPAVGRTWFGPAQ